ncbi:MAG: DUF456 domain-containing protein [Caldilineales bacterium]
MENAALLILLAYVLIFVGFIGSLLPLVPGPIFIWLGVLAWAVQDGFASIGWPTLVLLALLTIAAWGSDLALTALISRRVGASWKAVGGAIVGGFAGGLLFGAWIPVLGTLVATILGAVAGMIALEYLDKHNLRLALRSTRGYLFGVLASSLLEAMIAVLMIVIFIWQAFL